MAVLRVVDRRVDDRRRVSVSWVDGSTLTHEMHVSLPVDGAESEKVRWYLEDYAEFPSEPAPAVARDAEALLAMVGRQLFEQVFAERGATRVWDKAEADLAGGAGGDRHRPVRRAGCAVGAAARSRLGPGGGARGGSVRPDPSRDRPPGATPAPRPGVCWG